MGRKSAVVTIEGDKASNRDAGKTFLLTEMSATATESWAVRALGAMQRAGVEIPDHVIESGIIGMSAVGLRALMGAPWTSDVEPLMAEMMACVKMIMPATPEGRALVEEDIEEVSTRLRLRDEVFKLHTGFSIATALLTAVAVSLSAPKDEASSLPLTPTSPTPSEPFSQPA